MRIKKLITVCVGCLVVSCGSWALAQSQKEASEQPSLGNLARQLKTQREQAARKPSKVFTNENLPARPTGRGLTVAGQMSAEAPSEQTEETQAESSESKEPEAEEKEAAQAETKTPETAAPASTDSESSDVHDEGYYRSRAGELRSQREMHQRQLSVLEQKLAQNQMQFYGDPNKTLQQEFSRKDVVDLAQDIEKKKQEIAADEQAISGLQDQLRREGAPSGWLR
jgi:TATA-binding protein-associated factor Taf7